MLQISLRVKRQLKARAARKKTTAAHRSTAVR